MNSSNLLPNFCYALFTKFNSRFRERERESKKPSLNIFAKTLSALFIFVAFFFLNPHPVFAAVTRYVNADSSGAANNPTRPFNDPSYSPNDSYQTLTAAYTAASAGDTIEFSGGTSGKSYAGSSSSLSKTNLTLQGSSITNYNGPVTITYNASTGCAISIGASGVTVQNLTISGSNSGNALCTSSANTTGNRLILASLGNSLYGIQLNTGATGATFTNIVTPGTTGRAIELGASTTSTFNNCEINASLTSAANIDIYAGVTANFTNCVFNYYGKTTGQFFYARGGATSTINTTNSYIGPTIISITPAAPNGFIAGPSPGTIVWNSTNDNFSNGLQAFYKIKANLGFISFSTDDESNIGYFQTVANYAMSTYGIRMTVYVNNTQNLTPSEILTLQTLYKQGDEIGVHTRDHGNLYFTAPFTIKYTGANANMAAVVSGSGTSFSITGSGDTHGPIDLTNPSYNTVGALCTLIGTWTNFTCTINTDASGSVATTTPSFSLKDATTSLPISSIVNIPFDDNTGPTNRYYSWEITDSINDLQTDLHQDSGCASYQAKTLAFPDTEASPQVVAWIKANTSLIGTRSAANNGEGDGTSLTGIDVYNIQQIRPIMSDVRGPNYNSLTLAQQQARITQGGEDEAVYAAIGQYGGILCHNTSECTIQEYEWYIDGIAKYMTAYNLAVDTFANNITTIITSGNWTGSAGVWSRTFTGTDDYRLLPTSSLINAGTTVAGRTTDILGNPLVGTPDIGAYEFQSPAVPSGLLQYQSDGVTGIGSGGTATSTSVTLKFSMSSVNASDSLTPQVEVQPVGTSFTNIPTATGSAVLSSGSPVTGSVTVPGLTSGTSYTWQALVSNASGQSSWVPMGGNPDFVVNTTAAAPASPTSGGSSLSSAPSPNCPLGFTHCISAGPNNVGGTGVVTGDDSNLGVQALLTNFTDHDDIYLTITKQTTDTLTTHHIPFPWAQGMNTASEIYDFNAVSAFNGYPIPTFDHPATVMLTYDPTKLNGHSPNDLRIAWYDPSTSSWKVLHNNTVLNPMTHTIANTTTHFSYFAVVFDTGSPVLGASTEESPITSTVFPTATPEPTISTTPTMSNPASKQKQCFWFICW